MSLLAQEDESELKMALQLLSELRDLRKKTVFLQMMKEIEDLKSQLKQSKKHYEILKQHIKNLTIENDWLHSLTGTPVNSPMLRKDLDLNKLFTKMEKMELQDVVVALSWELWMAKKENLEKIPTKLEMKPPRRRNLEFQSRKLDLHLRY